MKKNIRLIRVVALVLSLLLIFTACSNSGSKPDNSDSSTPEDSNSSNKSDNIPSMISIAAASPGGTLYILGSTMSSILKDKINMESTVESTGGAVSNVQLLESNQSMFGIFTTDVSYAAWNGNADWTGGKEMRNSRAVMPLYVLQLQVISRADANLSKISDLNGKAIAAGPAGSAHDTLARSVLELFDIKPSKIINLPLGDTVDQMQDRLVDALMVVSSAPNSTLTNISTTMDAKFIPFSDEEAQKISETLPFLDPYTIPADTYDDQPEDYNTLTEWGFLAVSKDQPDELVYNITKTILEDWDTMEAAVSSTIGVKPQDIESINIPLHPGAAKYYEEIGVTIPDKLKP